LRITSHHAKLAPNYEIVGLKLMIQVKQQLRLIIGLALLIAISIPGLSAAYAQDDSGTPATVAPDFVFVRESPGTTAAEADVFPRGTSLTVHGRENQPGNGGMWVLVTPTSGGITGWVLVDLLNFDPSFVLNTLPIIDPASDEVVSTTTTTTTAADDDAAEVTTTASTAAAAIGDGFPGQTKQLANLRNGPELTFDIVEQFQPNTDAIFLGRNANSVWLYVVVEDQAGWFFSGLVDVDGNVNALPVVNPDGTRADSGEAVVTTTVTEDGDTVPAASSGATTSISLSVKPGTPANAPDGRLNGSGDDLGSVLVYCVTGDGYTNAGNFVGGGVAVYRFQGENPGIVLFAPEALITAAKSGSRPDGALASGNGYNIYYVEGNTLLLTGTDSGGDSFVFRWENCNQGGRID
jgi:hypothetical protein